MAHQFESGFVVREQAWHGLATVLPENPSVEEALKESGLDWDVEVRPMQTTISETVMTDLGVTEEQRVIDVPEGRVIVRPTDKSVLGYVSKQYKPFQNREGFGWFQPLIDDGTARLVTAGSLQSGRKVWMQAQYDDSIEVKDGDVLIPYLLLAMGHDGKMSVRIQNTPIRVVCWNTMQAAGVSEDGDVEQAAASGFSISHKGDINAKANAARRAIVAMNTELKQTVDVYRRMTKLPVGEDYVRNLAKNLFDADYMKARDLINKFREREEMSPVDIREETRKKIAELESILNTEGRAERKIVEAFHESPGCEGKTAWDAFNAVTYHIDHKQKGTQDSRLSSSWFGAGSRKRAKAFQLITGSAGM
tara:strand:- start:70 stop:1158 length:1089 start_codon:yes stop_codon:yes gene_type:complete